MNTAAAFAAAVIMRALRAACVQSHKPKRGEVRGGAQTRPARHKRQ